jgi:hypothetical protein
VHGYSSQVRSELVHCAETVLSIDTFHNPNLTDPIRLPHRSAATDFPLRAQMA